MASQIIVHVLFRGLIAFVPTDNNGTVTEVSALVINSKTAKDAFVLKDDCAKKHSPIVMFHLPKAQCVPSSKCTFSDDFCTCTLSGDVISLKDGNQLSHTELRKKPLQSKPHAPEPASDYSYVVDMANLNTMLPKPETYQKKLAGQMTIPFSSLRVCKYALGGYQEHFVRLFDFKPFKAIQGPIHTQALGTELMATVVVNSSSQDVTLALSNGGAPLSFTLPILDCPGGIKKCVEILVENEPPGLDLGDKCLDGVGHDFGLFYALTRDTIPDWKQVALPHLSPGDVESSPELTVPGCEFNRPKDEVASIGLGLLRSSRAQLKTNFLSFHNHPICPMATFFP